MSSAATAPPRIRSQSPRKRPRPEDDEEEDRISKMQENVKHLISNKQEVLVLISILAKEHELKMTEITKAIEDEKLKGFSSVTFDQVAFKVHLDPGLQGRDMKQFEIERARLPKAIFDDIMKDFESTYMQYGGFDAHTNEETLSRFLSPLFNTICRLFKQTIMNMPEVLLPGRLATKGRVEYRFVVMGGINFLVLEVKPEANSNEKDYLNAVAQVIAEADACDNQNMTKKLDGYPIYCMLAIGRLLYFFRMVNRPPENSGTEQAYGKQSNEGGVDPVTDEPESGVNKGGGELPGDADSQPKLWFESGMVVGNQERDRKIIIDQPQHEYFSSSIRPICEAIFCLFLDAYINGLKHKQDELVTHQIMLGGSVSPLLAFSSSIQLAEEARRLAVGGSEASRGSQRDLDKADRLAEQAIETLERSVNSVDPQYRAAKSPWSNWQKQLVVETWQES